MSMIEAAEFGVRCEAIRLDKNELARRVGRHPNTIKRVLEGKNSLTDTVSEINRVLVAEELRLRDHCLALHPLNGSGLER
jgi:predicted transcriptional regulator